MEDVMERADVFADTEELPFPGAGETPVQVVAAEHEEAGVTEAAKEERKEISIKFAKGLCSEPFMAKDGKEYVQIKIPETDKGIWPTFVLPANHVHENEHGKGLWAKIPEEGTTKLRRTQVIGEDENGKKLYDHTDEKVPNKTLKAMVEAYKEKNREEKPSILSQLSEPVEKAASKGTKPPTQDMAL